MVHGAAGAPSPRSGRSVSRRWRRAGTEGDQFRGMAYPFAVHDEGARDGRWCWVPPLPQYLNCATTAVSSADMRARSLVTFWDSVTA